MRRSRALVAIAAMALGACEDGCPGDDLGNPVTGGPTQGWTPEYEQAEAVVTVTRVAEYGNEDVVTVTFNDRTEDPGDPKVVYPTPEERTVYHGASLMGWSYSLNDGASFTYGGKVSPPEGWAVMWGDPAIETVGPGISGDVYLANLGGSDLAWPASGELVNQTMLGRIDGFCISRSQDGGLTFVSVRCFKHGSCAENPQNECTADEQCAEGCLGDFYDGSALESFSGGIYFASQNVDRSVVEVWRADVGTLDFKPMADLRPFDDFPTMMHPRFRRYLNRLYVMAQRENGIHMATYLDTTTDLWRAPLSVSYPSPKGLRVYLSDRTLRFANQFSFDLGYDDKSERHELRVLHTRRREDGKLFVYVVTCDADLVPQQSDPLVAQCYQTGWTTKDTPGDQFAPLLKRNITEGPDVAPAIWKAVWLSREDDPNGNVIEVRHANLATSGGVHLLVSFGLVEPQVPCSSGDPSDPLDVGYWGDYNDLIQLIKPTDFYQNTRFVTPFTRNGTNGECDFRTEWTADMHVGAKVFQ